jgi:hypothetical protein
VTFDLGDNYWGTTDPAQIAMWIKDRHDDPDINGEVIYEPFYGQPIATEPASFSQLKALFGREE